MLLKMDSMDNMNQSAPVLKLFKLFRQSWPFAVGILGLMVSFPLAANAVAIAASPSAEAAPRQTLSQLRAQLLDISSLPLARSLPEAELGETIVTENTLSPIRPTTPSLWWVRDQVGVLWGSDRLVEDWIAYAEKDSSLPAYIDVIVNRQIWDLLNYLERYAFINQFGTTAKSYGYSLRVFSNEQLSGAYICDFSGAQPGQVQSEAAIADLRLTAPCSVSLNYFARGGIRGDSPEL